jgi:hypothetical protein
MILTSVTKGYAKRSKFLDPLLIAMRAQVASGEIVGRRISASRERRMERRVQRRQQRRA